MKTESVGALSELDPKKVLELQMSEDDDPGLLRDLFDIFCSESQIRVVAMKEAYKIGDYKRVSREAHTFCSTCHNVAATCLANAVKQIELRSSTLETDDGQMESLIWEIEIAAGRIREEWTQMLNDYFHGRRDRVA